MGGAVQPDSVSTHCAQLWYFSLCSSFDILSPPGCRHPLPVDASRNNRVPVFALFPGNSIKAKLTIRIKAMLTSIQIKAKLWQWKDLSRWICLYFHLSLTVGPYFPFFHGGRLAPGPSNQIKICVLYFSKRSIIGPYYKRLSGSLSCFRKAHWPPWIIV